MINADEFREHAHRFVDWMADYLENTDRYPVKSQVKPGDIYGKIPNKPPLKSEVIDDVFRDFKELILPGITHWQSPNFFGYFPANSSYPSLLAEMLTATLGAQCMVWETSPAAAELEEKVMNWLKQMIGLPEYFEGVIQDTASTATLTALLTAREKLSEFHINEQGFLHNEFRIYCSAETHSSVEKAVKIAGFGRSNLVKVKVDENFRMDSKSLREAIERDLKNDIIPVCIIATLGTTGSTAIDPLNEIAEIAAEYEIWLHVDAAFAGTALILDEYKWMIKGIEKADSFVFNPHKWMFTNFDCSAYFVKDKKSLIKTFEINPEYLKTKTQGLVNDYRDWGIQLGRRFRALKLWFVIRNFGMDGLKNKIRLHIDLAKEFERKVADSREFEIITQRTLNLICFRFKPQNINNNTILNDLNEKLLHTVNAAGKIFITHTKLNGIYTLRMVIGQTNVTGEHVNNAWQVIQTEALKLTR
ncbi:MAG: aspartate aminotransferase family protein [Bacteroidetes bacterium 4484_249]|nr:MAG: aspartate aminotransferase family protein [Bacteroidetes bacterium 4484_249]